MIFRVIVVIFFLVSSVYGKDSIIKTELNEYRLNHYTQTAMRLIPHGLVDQAKDSIIALNGADSLLSFDRSFQIGSNSYGYIAYKSKDGIEIYLISCSNGNTSFVITTGICKKGDWRFELLKLIELSTLKLEELGDTFPGEK